MTNPVYVNNPLSPRNAPCLNDNKIRRLRRELKIALKKNDGDVRI